MNLYHTQNKRGVTLVELLVVLGIIGLLASISIPLVATMAPTPMRTIETASRELFTLLKGARIYATTYNVKTAVVYSMATPRDSLAPNDRACPVLDAVALGRALTRKELVRLDRDPNADIYVPVKSRQGRFSPMRGGTCVMSRECDDTSPVLENRWYAVTFLNNRGMKSIDLFDLDSFDFITPTRFDPGNPSILKPPLPDDGVLTGEMSDLYRDLGSRFPAHVFLPSGGMPMNAFGGRQRARLSVGLLPSADADDRLTLENIPRTVTLSLYQAQGRVKIES